MSNYYSDEEQFAVVRNTDDMPGPILSLLKIEQIRSLSRWAPYCNIPIEYNMMVCYKMYSFNKEYFGKVVFLGNKEQCLENYSLYMQGYSRRREIAE